MTRKRCLIGWTLSLIGLMALIVFVAGSGIFVHLLYTRYMAELIEHYGDRIPGYEVGDAIRAMSYTARDIPRMLVMASSFLMIAGWLIAGSPAGQLAFSSDEHRYQTVIIHLRYFATILLVIGIAWLLNSAMLISEYTVQASYDIWTGFRCSGDSLRISSHTEALKNIHDFMLVASQHYRPAFLPPIMLLAVVHLLGMALWWRGKRKELAQND